MVYIKKTTNYRQKFLQGEILETYRGADGKTGKTLETADKKSNHLSPQTGKTGNRKKSIYLENTADKTYKTPARWFDPIEAKVFWNAIRRVYKQFGSKLTPIEVHDVALRMAALDSEIEIPETL